MISKSLRPSVISWRINIHLAIISVTYYSVDYHSLVSFTKMQLNYLLLTLAFILSLLAMAIEHGNLDGDM